MRLQGSGQRAADGWSKVWRVPGTTCQALKQAGTAFMSLYQALHTPEAPGCSLVDWGKEAAWQGWP